MSLILEKYNFSPENNDFIVDNDFVCENIYFMCEIYCFSDKINFVPDKNVVKRYSPILSLKKLRDMQKGERGSDMHNFS